MVGCVVGHELRRRCVGDPPLKNLRDLQFDVAPIKMWQGAGCWVAHGVWVVNPILGDGREGISLSLFEAIMRKHLITYSKSWLLYIEEIQRKSCRSLPAGLPCPFQGWEILQYWRNECYQWRWSEFRSWYPENHLLGSTGVLLATAHFLLWFLAVVCFGGYLVVLLLDVCC